MRVGLVAKGLLLKGDLDLELVLLCKDKPTAKLLEKVAENLGVQLAVSPGEIPLGKGKSPAQGRVGCNSLGFPNELLLVNPGRVWVGRALGAVHGQGHLPLLLQILFQPGLGAIPGI